MHELRDHALINGGFDAVGLKIEGLGDGDVSLKASGEAGEESGAVIGARFGRGEAVELFVNTNDGGDGGGFRAADPRADHGFVIRVGVHERLGGFSGVDVGDFDFFEHGGGELKRGIRALACAEW